MTELIAQVSSNGDIIESKIFAVQNNKSAEIKIKPDIKLVSKVKVLVYYFTEGGEIISDSVSVEFGKEFVNKVSCGYSLRPN